VLNFFGAKRTSNEVEMVVKHPKVKRSKNLKVSIALFFISHVFELLTN
jgi:hypothetical protein